MPCGALQGRRRTCLSRQCRGWGHLDPECDRARGIDLETKGLENAQQALEAFFAWLATQGWVPVDPAVGLVLPKAEHRLPEVTLSAEETEAVLAGPDVTTALGLRDRAILEILYPTAIRRAELIGLKIWDIDHARGTVFVRQGKGAKNHHVPIGSRALLWVARYSDLVRPKLVVNETDVLFLSASGGPLCADWLSRTAKAYIAAGAPEKRGSCHLFRHTAATLMLEGGADIRYVSEMLGHAKLETTALYTRVSIAKLRAVHPATHPAGNDASGAEVSLLRSTSGLPKSS